MKKGFTIVEFIVSFSLTMVIAVFLFQIIIILKNIFDNNGVKTEFLNKQYLISDKINTTLKEKSIYSITKCGELCYEFTYTDGNIEQMKIENNSFTLGNYSTTLPTGGYFKDVEVNVIYSPTFNTIKNNAILNIIIPIYSDKLLNQNLGINSVYQYNTNSVIVDLETN